MKIKPGYKQTEVGIIPEDWEVAKFGDIASIRNDKATPLSASARTQCVELESIAQSTGQLLASIEASGPSPKYSFRRGDVLFGRLRPYLRKYWLATFDGLCSTEIWPLIPVTEALSGDFLHLLVQTSDFVAAADVSYGTRMPRADWDVLKELPVRLPPLLEQTAIATALSDMDALLDGLDRLIAKKRAIKLATMQQLLTGKTRLPGFRGKWNMYTVAELERMNLANLSRGQVISKKDIDNVPGNFPIYSSSIHNDGVFGRYGDFMFDEELITWSVDGGGHFFYRPKHKFSVTNVCGFMRVDTSRINCRFLAAELQLLHSRKVFDYQIKAHPSVIRKEYEVWLPELPEQAAIAAALSDMDSEIAALEARRDKTRALKYAMMGELLTGKTRLVRPKHKNANA